MDNFNIAKPSQLYCLKPIGIGTSDVESLTSYIKRLAYSHNLSVATLVDKEILPDSNKAYLQMNNLIEINRHCLNGYSELTKKMVEILEDKTLISNLKYLTLIPWENHIHQYKLHKRWHAWCPICYDEMKQTGQIYDKLIWNIEGIDICKKHQIKLEQICPYCGNKFKVLDFRSVAGFCDKCQAWLGYNDNDVPTIYDDWYNHIYDNVGKLISTTKESSAAYQFSNNINRIIVFFNSKKAFYTTYNLTEPVITRWLNGNRPALLNALILSLRLGYSLYELLTKEIDLSIIINNQAMQIKHANNPPNHINYQKIKEFLDKAISSHDGISLSTFCEINSISIKTLRMCFLQPESVTKCKAKV